MSLPPPAAAAAAVGAPAPAAPDPPAPGRRPRDPWQPLPPMPAPRAARPRWLVPLGVAISVGARGRARRAVTDRLGRRRPEPPRRVGPPGRRPGRLRRGRARPRLRPPGVRRLPHPGASTPRQTTERRRAPSRTTSEPSYERLRRRSCGPSAWRRASSTSYEAFNSVVDSGTLAFYDPTDERIRVRGTEMTRRARGHPRPRAHPRAAGPALRPRAAERPDARRRRVDRVPRAWPRAMPCGSRTPTSRTSSPRTSRPSTTRSTPSELADSEEATSDVPAVRRGDLRRALRPRPAVRHDARSTRTATTASTTPSSEPPDTEEHLFDPASFLAEEGADDDRARTSTTTTRCSTRGPSAPRRWYLFLAERIDPKVAFEAALGLERRRLRGLRARTARCACRPCSSATPTTTRRRWPPRSTTWVAAMVGGEAEVIEVDGHPGHRGLRPRRGRRPRAHRPLRDVAVPPEPLGLPRGRRRRRCSMPSRAAATPARSSTT